MGNGHVLGLKKEYEGQSDAAGQSDAMYGIEEGDRCWGSFTSMIWKSNKTFEDDFVMLSKKYVDGLITFLFDLKRFKALSDNEFPSILTMGIFS